MVDITVLGSWSGALLTIGALFGVVYKFCRRADKIEEKIQEHDDCINDSLEERMILLRAQKAALEAVSGKRCNGNVDDSINEIDEYMLRKSHEK
ncbi:MAG: hypothetical protein ABGU93_06580 [Acetobacterium sp.]|uniref:hypothetical protein n=1 Tax=Acetobacterium TaxID=33951 RepID=UPI00203347F1|nr:hypothetical protein [Acetobacterium wieringae]URN83476.1 hypothetical protein CHL1_002613 [Acetobacterium wieringae]